MMLFYVNKVDSIIRAIDRMIDRLALVAEQSHRKSEFLQDRADKARDEAERAKRICAKLTAIIS